MPDTGRDSTSEQAEGCCDLLLANSKFVSLGALHPEIGAATTVALAVTGQQLASAVIDGRGLFRMPQRPLTPSRLAGMVLLIAGSTLIKLT